MVSQENHLSTHLLKNILSNSEMTLLDKKIIFTILTKNYKKKKERGKILCEK